MTKAGRKFAQLRGVACCFGDLSDSDGGEGGAEKGLAIARSSGKNKNFCIVLPAKTSSIG